MLNILKFNSEFGRNIFTLMSGTTIAQFIPIAISPILSRMYSPEDFGIFSFFVSIVTIISVVSTGKYEMSIILPKKDILAYQLVILSSVIVLLCSIMYLFFIVLSNIFYSFDIIYYLLPFSVLFIGLNNTLDKYNNRLKNYKLMSYQRLIKTTIESIINILFIFLFHIKTGLIWGFVLGFLFSNATMLYLNIKLFQKKAFKISKIKIKLLAKKYINFPKYNMSHALLNTISANASIFLIPIFYGNATLGFFAFGLKIVQSPLGLLSNAIFNVLGQKMAEEYSKGNEIYSIFKKALKKLSLFSILMIPFFVFADDIFGFIFGIEWMESGKYIQILSPWIILVFITSPLSILPHIYNQQKKALVIEIISIIIKLLILFLSGELFSIEITLFMLSIFSSCIVLYILSWYHSLVKKDK